MIGRSTLLGLLTVSCLVLAAGLLAAEEPAQSSPLSPALPYQAKRSNPVTHEVDFSVVVTPPYHCKVLKVWLPLPQSDAGQEISESQLTTFPETVKPSIATEPVYGNRFAYFEFDHPQGAQIIRHRFKARVWELGWGLEAGKVRSVKAWPQSFAPYLQPQKVTDSKQLDQILSTIKPQAESPAGQLHEVMSWINKSLTYDHVHASLRADANHALTEMRGHCSDYHGLCATMARALGYPTRVTYGLSLFPKNSPSHCKVEAYLPPYGWVSHDLSETQKLIKQIQGSTTLSPAEKTRLTQAAWQRLHSGYRENSWLLVTRGTNYDLIPKASQKVAVVRTIYAEADGEALPDPDPANIGKREFAWMTVHKFSADKKLMQPFKDLATLEPWAD